MDRAQPVKASHQRDTTATDMEPPGKEEEWKIKELHDEAIYNTVSRD